jgi:AcrR family transcriptional regulator
MNSDDADIAPKRAYRQTARAEAAEQTATRILDAFEALVRDTWVDEVTLDKVAADAGVSVQTVVRKFGGKEGLFYGIQSRLERDINARRFAVAPGDIEGAVQTLVVEYDTVGDLVMRGLVQEDRFPAVKRLTDLGRASHRAWLARTFASHLEGLPPKAAERRLDAIVAATDLYIWKLVRRDMGRSPAALRAVMTDLLRGALGSTPEAGGDSK